MDFPYSLFCIVLFVIALCFLAIRYVRKSSPVAIFVLCVYLGSAVLSIIEFVINPIEYPNINLLGYIYLFVIFAICLNPISNFKNIGNISSNISISEINLLSFVVIALIIPSMVLILSEIKDNILGLTVDLSYAYDMYNDSAERDVDRNINDSINIVTGLGAIASDWVIFLAAYYSTLKRKNKILCILLWICCIYPLLSGISGGSRAVMTYWFFDLAIAYYLFKPHYSPTINKAVKRVMLIAVLFMFSVMAALTIGRFTSGAYQGGNYVGSSIVSYTGQSTLNFDQYALDNEVYQWGDNTMPLFRKMVGLEASNNIRERQAKWGGRMKIQQGYFYTIFGDILFDWGPVLSFVLLLFLSLFILKHTHTTGSLKVQQLYLTYFWATIICNGVFYYSQKSVGGNWHLISMIIFYFILIILTRKKIYV